LAVASGVSVYGGTNPVPLAYLLKAVPQAP
jgi:hypothetical protein